MNIISLKDAEIAAEKAAIEAKKEAKKQELKAWALANGSELLKARIEENMNWFEMANEEWFKSVCPEGFSEHDDSEYDSCWDYKNPTMEHIVQLREARKHEVLENLQLRECRTTDEDGDKTFYYFVTGKIRSFSGDGVIEVSKYLNEEYVSADNEE